MRILFPCYLNPYYDSSAVGNRNESIINGLIKNGVKVNLIVTGGYNSFLEFKTRGYKVKNPNLKISYSVFVFQSSVWMRRINMYILSGFFYFFSSLKLKKYYNSTYDYLWLTGDLNIRKSFLKNKNLIKGKTIIEFSEYQEFNRINGIAGNSIQLKRQIEYTNITMNVLDHIDYFVVITNTLIEYYRKLTKNKGAKFFHLPMIVDLKRFQNTRYSLSYKNPYIAFTGTYTNLKDGVDILIKSFGKIASTYPDYHLYLAGFYHPDIKIQKKIIAELGLEDRITYLGVLDKNKIPVFICNADLLVLSRPDSYQAQGGFPTKLGEYLATSKPVCVTKVGEIPNYLEDNVSAYMAEPGNIDSFADAMNRALVDKKHSVQVGLYGRKVAEKCFNNELEIERFLEFLESSEKVN